MYRTALVILGTLAVTYVIPKKYKKAVDAKAKRLGKRIWKNYVTPAVEYVGSTSTNVYAKVRSKFARAHA